MRQLGYALTMLVLAATPSFAGSVLYATAVGEQRVDGFCLDRNGALAPNPNGKSFGTAADQPRRLLVAEGVITEPAIPEASRDVLYVALADRIEAFRILSHGGLESLGTTKIVQFMDPRDLLLSPAKNRLYVAPRGYNRIVAYDIQPDGSLSEDFSSCTVGRDDSRYVSLAGPPPGASSAAGAFLYASSEVNGRIDIYPLDATGNLLEVEVDENRDPVIDPVTKRPMLSKVSTNCKNVDGESPPLTVPFSSRQGLAQPKSMVLDGEMLYVEERARARITAFRLKDGLFCDSVEQCPGFDTLGKPRCLARQQKRIDNDKGPRHCPASHTNPSLQYENMVLFGDTLLGTQFFKGRIDGYRLRPSTAGPLLLPKGPKFVSEEDVRMTPVRSTARTLPAIRGECSDTDPARPCDCAATNTCAGVLYVGSGALNRVVAYALGAGGALPRVPFSRTDEDKDSFPNDVAVAVLPDACR
jgi:hypothetical protein